ncbi:LysR family transcriptional regulator [Streptomyces sp. NPDC050548]|uniref:LysR family transcriptional regulator n=1 Tax=Streptomyces sp. NPDC050548 TaxID=3365629 RepID=UPI0037A2D8F9
MTDLPPAPDLELRLVRYFIAVAEQRHFGRAAESLHITQPSLSRQVRRLEEQLGARLLDRTPQGTRLTEAGEVFLPRAKGLLRATAQAAAETRAAAEPSRLTVGYMANLFVTPAVREVRRRHPDADVHVVHLAYDDVRAALLERRVDAVVARLPFSTDELEVTILYGEPRVLLVPLDHRLAGKESVTVDDIADEPVPQLPGADPAWAAFWRIDPRPDGRPAPGGPVIRALADKFEFVADGRAVAIAAGIRPGQTLRPDIVAIPLHGVEPSHVALATRAGEHNRLLSAFRKAAHALLRAPADADEHPDGAH